MEQVLPVTEGRTIRRVAEAEADSHACKFEQIISPELDPRICTFLGHPKTCPHGNPILPGRCCPSR